MPDSVMSSLQTPYQHGAACGFLARLHQCLREKQWLPVLTIIVAGILIRFFTSGMRVFVSPDSMAYWYTAEAILAGDWIHTYVERTPGYPVFLMLIQGLTMMSKDVLGASDPQVLFQKWLLLAQSVLGIVNALLLNTCAKRLTQNTVLAFYAGLVMLLLPDLLLYEHAFLAETIYTTGLLLWFTCFLSCQKTVQDNSLQKPYLLKVALLGLLTGWLMLVKPIAVSVAICGTIGLWRNKRYVWQSIALFGAAIATCILPWMMMNANVHGTFTLAAGKGANQLYKMIDDVDWVSPLAGEYKIQLHQRYLVHPEGETYNAVNDVHVLMDGQAKRKPNYSAIYLKHDENAGLLAWEAITQHPLSWIYQTAKQWLDFFVKPSTSIVRLPLFSFWSIFSCQVWQVLMLLSGLGAIVAISRRNLPFIMAFALVMSHSVLYALSTLADARYHIPLEPFALLLAVYLVSLLIANPAGDPQEVSQKL